MPFHSRLLWVLAGLYGLGGVGLLAVAAHALADAGDVHRAQQVGILWLAHAPALLMISCLPGTWMRRTGFAMALGLGLFGAGVLWHLAMHRTLPFPLAPSGGMLLMFGWVLLILRPLRRG